MLMCAIAPALLLRARLSAVLWIIKMFSVQEKRPRQTSGGNCGPAPLVNAAGGRRCRGVNGEAND